MTGVGEIQEKRREDLVESRYQSVISEDTYIGVKGTGTTK